MSTIAHRVEVAPHNKKLKSLLQGPGFRPLFSPCFYCFFCTVLSNKSQNVKNKKKKTTSFNLFCTHLSDNHQLLGGRYILTHFLIFFLPQDGGVSVSFCTAITVLLCACRGCLPSTAPLCPPLTPAWRPLPCRPKPHSLIWEVALCFFLPFLLSFFLSSLSAELCNLSAG